jgi:hypothetical protein
MVEKVKIRNKPAVFGRACLALVVSSTKQRHDAMAGREIWRAVGQKFLACKISFQASSTSHGVKVRKLAGANSSSHIRCIPDVLGLKFEVYDLRKFSNQTPDE